MRADLPALLTGLAPDRLADELSAALDVAGAEAFGEAAADGSATFWSSATVGSVAGSVEPARSRA